MTHLQSSARTRTFLAAVFLGSGLIGKAPAQSVWEQCHQPNLAGDVNACPADRPCITKTYQEGNNMRIGWSGNGNYDVYDVIAGESGQRVGQADVNGGSEGSYQISNVRPCATFIVKVQGCNTRLLRSATCSPWTETTVQASPSTPSGVDTCLQGFVWRNAYPGDHVCVTPDVRSQVAADNAQAAARRSPNGGPFGADTCRQGFVWRGARASDHVCVTPEVQAQARTDNNAKCTRLASCH
jgi:hypothetical protein